MGKKQYPLRIEENIFSMVEASAEHSHRSVNGELNWLISNALLIQSSSGQPANTAYTMLASNNSFTLTNPNTLGSGAMNAITTHGGTLEILADHDEGESDAEVV